MVKRMLISLLWIVFTFPGFAYAQSSGTTYDATITSHTERTGNKVTLVFNLNASKDPEGEYKVEVLGKGDRSLGTINFGKDRVATDSITFDKNFATDEYTFRIYDTAKGNAPVATVKASVPGSTGGGNEGDGTQQPPNDPNCTGYKFQNTLFGTQCADTYLARLYSWAVAVALIGATLMIIYAGFKYTTSRGDPSAINDAKDIIISTLVGLALLLLSYTILRVIGVNVRDPKETSQNTMQSVDNRFNTG